MRFFVAFVATLFLATTFKFVLLLNGVFPLNADEAVVGLLARHIQEGRWSAFFYGQAYLGSFDSALTAISFSILGPGSHGIRIVQIGLYAGTLATAMILAREILRSDWAAIAAGLLLAIPSLNVTLYTTVSIGGYGETLLLGNILLLLTLSLWNKQRSPSWWAAWGFVAGLGFWTFGLILVYVIPCGILVLQILRRMAEPKNRFQTVLLIVVAGVLGTAPWLYFAVAEGPTALVQELFGSAIAGATSISLLEGFAQHTINFLLFGTTAMMGIRPPWEIRWLVAPVIPLVIIFWTAATWRAIRTAFQDGQKNVGLSLLLGVMVVTIAGFILTPFGADPSGRYFLTLVVPLSIFGAGLLMDIKDSGHSIIVLLILIGLLGYNLSATYLVTREGSIGITTQFDPVTWIDHEYDEELISFLSTNNIDRGYANYWIAYPIALATAEKVQLVPGLPYHLDFRHTWRDHRYKPFLDSTLESENIAYITSNHAELDLALAEALTRSGSTFREADVGDYHLIYAIEPVRHLAELEGLPWDGRP